jgi:steroid delta-isomerase-like uncharacterized protein
MSAESNKIVVRRYIEEVINGGDLNLIDEFFAPGMRARVRGFLTSGEGAFPDGREQIQEIVAEGETVMAHWILRGTHQNPFMGMPATGKKIEIHGFAVYFFKDGQIVHDLMVMDWLDALEQLGATITLPDSSIK